MGSWAIWEKTYLTIIFGTFTKRKSRPISYCSFPKPSIQILSSIWAGHELQEQQKANMEKILVNLFEKRKQKIFLYLAYNKPLPPQLDNSEQDFYNHLLEEMAKHRIDPTKENQK